MRTWILLGSLILGSCAATTPRKISSAHGGGSLRQLDEDHVLACLHEGIFSTYGFYLKHGTGDGYEFAFVNGEGERPKRATATCEEKDNGISCLVSGNQVLRIDFSSEEHPAWSTWADHPAVASYQNVQFDSKSYHCTVTDELPHELTHGTT